jgi:spore coat protein U-like protein
MNSKSLAAAVVAWSVFAAGSASAATANGTLTVSATVADACSVADATLAFGAVNPASGVTTALSANINVTCTLGTTFTVGLGNGSNANSGVRRLRRGVTSDYLTYELYKDMAGTTRFGDTNSGDRAAGTGLGVGATAISVYGKIPSGQTAAAGAYSDSVVITLYY